MVRSTASSSPNSVLCELENVTSEQRESPAHGLASGWPLPHTRCKFTLGLPAGWMEPGCTSTYPLAVHLYSGHNIHSLVSNQVKSVSLSFKSVHSHWPIEYDGSDVMQIPRLGPKSFFTFRFPSLGMLLCREEAWNEGPWRQRGPAVPDVPAVLKQQPTTS